MFRSSEDRDALHVHHPLDKAIENGGLTEGRDAFKAADLLPFVRHLIADDEFIVIMGSDYTIYERLVGDELHLVRWVCVLVFLVVFKQLFCS